MNKILFVNSCVRPDSRTHELAVEALSCLGQNYDEVNLVNEQQRPLDTNTQALREKLISTGDYTNPLFRYAKQFAASDLILIAAPFWDLSFPALLKIYMESVTVAGITFKYEFGIPKGLCNAKKLIYITTAGGKIIDDFGFSYLKALAKNFYGISDTVCFKAEGLDIIGNDVSRIMDTAKQEIRGALNIP